MITQELVSIETLKQATIDDLENLLGVEVVSRFCFEHYLKYSPKISDNNNLSFVQTPDDD